MQIQQNRVVCPIYVFKWISFSSTYGSYATVPPTIDSLSQANDQKYYKIFHFLAIPKNSGSIFGGTAAYADEQKVTLLDKTDSERILLCNCVTCKSFYKNVLFIFTSWSLYTEIQVAFFWETQQISPSTWVPLFSSSSQSKNTITHRKANQFSSQEIQTVKNPMSYQQKIPYHTTSFDGMVNVAVSVMNGLYDRLPCFYKLWLYD